MLGLIAQKKGGGGRAMAPYYPPAGGPMPMPPGGMDTFAVGVLAIAFDSRARAQIQSGIAQIAERSNNLWKPSPGSVYPTLQMLEDEGLISAAQTEGSKKLFELTDAGRSAAEQIETAPWTEIIEGADPAQVNLREALGQLFGAVAQSAHAANADQQQRILDIVNNARREIYQILGES